MLGSVCTTFWPGNCWSDVAFFFFLVFFYFLFFYFRTLNFSQLFNSSSTFKYIVGLSLKIEIRLCILCTVSLKLCTAITVHQVCRSVGRVRREAWLGGREMAMQLEGDGDAAGGAGFVWWGFEALFKNKTNTFLSLHLCDLQEVKTAKGQEEVWGWFKYI